MEHVHEKITDLKGVVVHTLEIWEISESNDVDDPEYAQTDGSNDPRPIDGPNYLGKCLHQNFQQVDS